MIAAVAIFAVSFALALIVYTIAHHANNNTRIPTMNQPIDRVYRFKLYRIKTRSSLTIERECVDPFVERIKLGKEYPGWGIKVSSSPTDREYNALYGLYGLFTERDRPDSEA